MRIAKWGNSLAVRLPTAVVEALELREGSELDLHPEGRRTFRLSRKLSREEAIEELKRFEGRMPKDFKFDRDEANER